MAKILLLNGPNLNLLGSREPGIYGADSLSAITQRLTATAQAEGHQLLDYQSNTEGFLVDRIHAARDEDIAYIIFNPAAYTHTSIALRDALLGVGIPFTEVHLSNTHKRETFRHTSYFSDIAEGVICGLGAYGYELSLLSALKHLSQRNSQI